MNEQTWVDSSQKAANILGSGEPLWRREDIRDIERQLSQGRTLRRFTVRRVDGVQINIPNLVFGEEKSIWKPYVVFKHYWELVYEKPKNVPPETYLCSYVVLWENVSLKTFLPPVPSASLHFQIMKHDWEVSETCQLFKNLLSHILSPGGGQPDGHSMVPAKRVTKVICFGLGDMAAKKPDYIRLKNPHLGDTAFMNPNSVAQHAVAQTIRAVAQSSAADKIPQPQQVRLLTQDPAYSEATLSMLREVGEFEVIGEFGAAGFTEVDNDCIVFAPFVNAPVKQIVEAFARPVAMIYSDAGPDIIRSQPGAVLSDPDSPNTIKMREEYHIMDIWDLKISPPDSDLFYNALGRLKIYGRKN